MSNPKNGDYMVISDDKVVVCLGKDVNEAILWLQTYCRQSSGTRPEVYLVQVQARLEYPPPEIKTLAHEVME